VYQDALFVVVIVRVAADVIAAVTDQNALIEFASQTLGDDTSGVAGSHNQEIVHCCLPVLFCR
jgi:hypothetical protein